MGPLLSRTVLSRNLLEVQILFRPRPGKLAAQEIWTTIRVTMALPVI